MSWRVTAVLFLILLLLGGYVYWQQNQETILEEVEPFPTSPAQTETAPLFPNLVADEVIRLEIVDLAADLAVTFMREDDGRWYQTVPTRTEVISVTLENHSRNLVNLTSRRVLPAGANPLAAYGLDNPAHELIVASQQGERVVLQRLLIGNLTPTNDAYYAQRPGNDRVYIVAAFSLDNILSLRERPPHLQPLEQP
jgi:hypothetical protein